MRSWMLALSFLVISACGSNAKDGDTGTAIWEEDVDSDGDSDADGSTGDDGADADADGGDDTGNTDADADADADGGDDTGSSDDTGEPDAGPALVFALDVAAAIAGTPVGFQVTLVAGDDVTALSDYTISSDLVEDVPVDADELILELAGEHTLTATHVDESGTEWT